MQESVKGFRIIFDGENRELHKKIKIMAALLDESMNEFVIDAIKAKIQKLEKKQK